MYKLLVGAGVIAIIIVIMATTGTYINAYETTDLYENIDTSTDMGHRANQTMQNRSKAFDSGVNGMSMIALIMVITLPLGAIIIYKKFI